MSLNELVEQYLDALGYNVEENGELDSRAKKPIKFDFKCKDQDQKKVAVVVKDWARNIGINVIRAFQEKVEDCPELSYGVLCADHFSLQVRKDTQMFYQKVQLLSKHDILTKMNC